MASKSKNKGKGFEREVCDILSNLYNANFERVPHSGAFVGGSNAFRKDKLTENQIQAFKGDIIPPDTWRHFNCECKNYADFPFHQLLQNKPQPTLEEWLGQTLDAHDKYDLDLLFMKFNRKGIYLAFPTGIKQRFHLTRYLDYTSNVHGSWTLCFWADFANPMYNNISTLEQLARAGVHDNLITPDPDTTPKN